MANINGVVQAMSNKYDKYSVLVNETWYSSKFEISCAKGDTVEFDDGDGKKYCRKLRVVASGGGVAPSGSTGGGGGGSAGFTPNRAGFPVAVDTKDRSIVRQNSLAHATNIVKHAFPNLDLDSLNGEEMEIALEKLVETVIDVARKFEDYSAGDTDMREAQELISKE